MKILMLAPFPLDMVSVKGGVESATLNLLAGLKAQNCNVLVVSFNKEIKEKKELNYSNNITVCIYPFQYPHSTFINILFSAVSIIKKRIKNFAPDIIHVQGNGSRFLYMLAGIKRNKWVFTAHGSMAKERKNARGLIAKLNYTLMILSEYLFIKKTDGFIFISNYTKNYFEKIYKINGLQTIIFNAVNPIFFDVAPPKKMENNLLYIGVLNNRKGLLQLLLALNKLKVDFNYNFKLNIVGGYVDNYFEHEVEEFFKNSSIKENIFFLGWKNQKELTKIFNSSDVFVLPSTVENLPISVAEALAAGRVVVATNAGGTSEMISKGQTGYIYDWRNNDELVDILKSIYNSEEATHHLSNNCKKSAKDLFHPNSVAEKTINFYEKIIEYEK